MVDLACHITARLHDKPSGDVQLGENAPNSMMETRDAPKEREHQDACSRAQSEPEIADAVLLMWPRFRPIVTEFKLDSICRFAFI